MSSHHLGKKILFLLSLILGVLALLQSVQAGDSNNDKKSTGFSPAAAIAGLSFDAVPSVANAASAGPRFSLRGLCSPGKNSSSGSQVPDLEPVEAYGSFFGVRLTLQIKGGWSAFSGGDIENGVGGMYEKAVDLIAADGAVITQSRKNSNTAGLEFGGDLIYCITPRFGVGVGLSNINAGKESALFFEIRGPDYERMNLRPRIKVSVLRFGLFYAIPFAGRLAISVHGGPALYSARYSYNTNITVGSYGMPVIQAGFLPMGLYQEASAKQLGLEGGIGFEFNANPFVAFCLEALGRYARIDGFEGLEEATLYQDYRRQVLTQEGSLYLLNTNNYPLLDIVPPEGSAGEAARKASLDFSGFSFTAGLKLRF